MFIGSTRRHGHLASINPKLRNSPLTCRNAVRFLCVAGLRLSGRTTTGWYPGHRETVFELVFHEFNIVPRPNPMRRPRPFAVYPHVPAGYSFCSPDPRLVKTCIPEPAVEAQRLLTV
jgi:hypothetical protein